MNKSGLTLGRVVQPDTIEEAYQALTEHKDGAVLGGCAFLLLGSRKIGTAVDLSRLNLDYIKEQDEHIEIGAMATFRDVETSPVLQAYFSGVLPRAAGCVIGVQFRNIVTVGATVYSKYGFSDLITPLMALDAEVELFKGGRMPLAGFMEQPAARDILTRVFIKKSPIQAAYQNLRNSATDYPILNVAVSSLHNRWRVFVGARPQRAQIAPLASEELSRGTPNYEAMDRAAGLAAEELPFGNNNRGSAEYRKAMCKVLIKRAVTEVLECK